MTIFVLDEEINNCPGGHARREHTYADWIEPAASRYFVARSSGYLGSDSGDENVMQLAESGKLKKIRQFSLGNRRFFFEFATRRFQW